MARVIPIEHAAAAIGLAMADMVEEAFRSGKVEGVVEVGDQLAATQRYKSGAAAHSTTASGTAPIFVDPGEGPDGFFMPASRMELEQQANARIRPEPPPNPAHVTEGAGMRQPKGAYAGILEKRYGTARKVRISINANKRAHSAAAERRAARHLADKGYD